MPRLNKLRKAKKFRYNVSRKRQDRKHRSTGTIKCPEIKNAWERNKTITTNLREIGLGYDPNKVIAIPNARRARLELIKKLHGFVEEDNDGDDSSATMQQRPKGFVMEQMEADANALRVSNFRLPKGLIAQLSYMMDKHHLNYAAMTFDQKNYDQWTWKQFRAKIRKFMSIPEQFGLYLVERDLDSVDWEEYNTADELY